MRTSKLINAALKRRGLIHSGIRHNTRPGRLLADEWREDGEILPLVNDGKKPWAKEVKLDIPSGNPPG